ncbi:MAG: NRDE family protein [Chryseolinea sp.]
MCLIFISHQNHPDYKLIVAGNRDEFYNRTTAAAAFWNDSPGVLAGRDLEAGGTWMGVNKRGKVSMLTNYRDPGNIDPNAPSRGALVSDFLTGDVSSEMYIDDVASDGGRYNGFNLLARDSKDLYYYSNYGKGVEKLAPGFYGISNKLLDSPWPKVIRGKQRIGPAMAKVSPDVDEILDLLCDNEKAPLDQLPETGLTKDRELALSPMFIKTDNYGSRCSTVVLIDKNDNVTFSERVYEPETFRHSSNIFRFKAEQ